ncbi:aminotransferase-like domain-containing protein [Methylobacterium sp. 275MFSha3.1]|jgi:DNA-binding transcriptional MocR family regulator|uniref:aminotransferase-like domain-containing protein n=1 Tax=Methylobacterium sp. 275MFSha3.1 TaxID=1502746 RepID=UPI0008A7AC3C|nr:PLP-dependent aminotransferase family protein [Methylobacterium sp. 275MFSha3.1]SEH60158.1 DNA-binding transcriptional regulator, MocR family, contains an aminotransferase domain [Methylobacterium sp. 275MFSha3.1]
MMESWSPTIAGDTGPKYLAIVRALAEDIRAGRLSPGARLPPQRALAKHLNVDLTTVTRAFNEARRTGLIDATAGRGSFVRASRSPAAEMRRPDPSGSVDFSMNMPPQPEAARLAERLEAGLSRLAGSSTFLARMQYQDSAGNLADRAAAAHWLGQRLGALPMQRVLVAGGAQVVLAAVLAAVLKPGDALCVPALTYPGLRMAAERRGVRLLPVAGDAEGLDPDALLERCRSDRPRALYLVPTLDNPTTATLPAIRRRRIAEIARTHGVAIIEDDAYGALPHDAPAPIASQASDITWHIATLSKCASPGLRIAYVAVPGTNEAVRLAAELRAINMMASPLTAALASHWIAEGELDGIVAAIRQENELRQAVARETLRDLDVWAHPCGHHLWLRLPDPWRRGEFGAHARQLGVSVVPSDAFAVGAAPEAIRVSLGAAPDAETLRYGLSLLATLLAHPPGAISTVV